MSQLPIEASTTNEHISTLQSNNISIPMEESLEKAPTLEFQDSRFSMNDFLASLFPSRGRGWRKLGIVFLVIILGLVVSSFFLPDGDKPPGNANNTISGQPSDNPRLDPFTPTDLKSALHINLDTVVENGNTLTATGRVILQNNTNSSAALSVQDASGNNLLVADTTGNRIKIGDTSNTDIALEVRGDALVTGTLFSNNGNTSLDNSGLRINSVLVCTANGCIAEPDTDGGEDSTTDLSAYARLAAGQTFTGANVFSSTSNSFAGDGSGLSSVNAATLGGQPGSFYTNATNLTSGTLSNSRLASSVTLQGNAFNGANQLVRLTAGGLLPVLDGSNLTNVDAASLGGNNAGYYTNATNLSSGTLNDSRLSSNVALLNANQIFSGNNTFQLASSAFAIQDAATPLGINLFEVTDDTGVTVYFNVDATGAFVNGNEICTVAGNCAGVGGQVGGSGTIGTIALFTANSSIGDSILTESSGTVSAAGNLNVTGQYRVNGSQISSSNLSNDANLAKLDGTQTFSGDNTFSSASNSFTGNGSGLTSLNASNVSSGTLADARLSNNVTLQGNTFNGGSQLVQLTAGGLLPVLDGSNLTNVDAATLGGLVAGNFVQLAQGVQTDSSTTNPSIGINKTGGTADILQLQKAGSDVLRIDNSGYAYLTPTSLIANNSVGFTQTYTAANATTNGAQVGQYISIDNTSNSVAAAGSYGLFVRHTDNGSVANDNVGISIDMTGTNAAQSQIGLDSNVIRGIGVRVLTTGVSGASQGCAGVNTTDAVGLCAGSIVSVGTSGTGIYGRTTGASSGTISDSSGTGVYGTATSTANAGQFVTGVKGITSAESGTNAYTSTGVFGQSSGNANATTYGGYFTFESASAATSGAALYASNNASTAKIFQLQDGATDVMTVADGGAVSFTTQTNSAAAFVIQNATAADTLFTADTAARNASGGNLIKIGNSTGTDGDTTILVLDHTTADPSSNLSALSGGLFYNSTTNKLSIIENGTVKVLCNQTDASCGGNSTTLQQAYDASTSSPQITLNSSPGAGGLVLRDASSTVGNLFTVQDNAGLTNYFNVTNAGINATNITVASSGYISLAGGATGTRPSSPTAGMLYYDTDTDQLLQYNGTKWVSDRNTSTKIVAASNSSQSAKDAADYVADGTDDQVEINAALTAAAGGTVYLMEGTYVVHQTNNGNATILVPNNTTLAGAGRGTLIELGNFDATDNLIENSDTSTGTGVVIRDLRLDGRKDLNTAGTQHGIVFNAMGNGTGSSARQGGFLSNLWIANFRSYAINLDNTDNSLVEGSYIHSNDGRGINLVTATYNRLVGNIIQGQGAGAEGIHLFNGSNYNTVSGNTIEGNADDGIRVNTASNNTITGNNISANPLGVAIDSNSDHNTVSGNLLRANTSYGIRLHVGSASGSSDNIITGNRIHDSGGSTTNNGISVESTDFSLITSNLITDTACTTTCYAIDISNSASDKTYLEGNRYSGSTANTASINDAGTNTIYVNQQTNSTTSTNSDVSDFRFRGSANSASAFQVQGQAGNSVLVVDTANDLGRVGIGNDTAPSAVLHVGTDQAGVDLFKVTDATVSSVDVLTIANEGATTFRNRTDSTTAFQIQNTSSSSLLNVDTTRGGAISLLGLNSGALQNTTWTTNANSLIDNGRRRHAVVAANGYIYTTGGQDSSGASQNDVQYARINADGTVGAFTVAGNTLPGVRWLHSSVVANGYIYVIAGDNDTTGQTTILYAKLNNDGTVGSWTTQASNPLPVQRVSHASASYNGYIYVLGGSTGFGGSAHNTVYYAKLNADGSTGAWTLESDTLPAARRDVGQGVAIANGYMYLVGGDDGASTQNTVFYAKLNADGSTGAWTSQGSNLLPSARNDGATVILNGYIYYIGGNNGTDEQDEVYYAPLNSDGTTGAWTTEGTLPAVRNTARAATVNGHIYVLGGADSAGTATTTVYYNSTARVRIGGSLDLVSLSGENLAEGGTGGELTAGNTNIIGSLNVRGSSTFGGSLAVQGTLTVNDNALFKNSINSATAFQIQNAAGSNLVSVDSTNGGNISLLGNNSGELGTWATETDLLPANSRDAAAVSAGGYAYVIGGRTSNTNASAVATIYYAKLNADGSTQSWSSTSSLPAARHSLGAAVVGGYIYAFGGVDTAGTIQSTVYYSKILKDGTLSPWSTTTSPAFSLYDHEVTTYNGYIYSLGGRASSGGYRNEVLIAKPTPDGRITSWLCQGLSGVNDCNTTPINANEMPATRSQGQVVAANGYLYYLGGTNSGMFDNVFYAKINADGTTGSFTDQLSDEPTAIAGATAGVANGYVYIIGGWNGSAAVNTYQYAALNSNGSTGSWTTGTTTFAANRELHSGILNNGYFYVFGGNNSGAQDDVYYSSVPRVKISGSLDLVSLSGENLVEGGTGGELTAGNTNIIGNLDVRGQTSLLGLSVEGSLTASGETAFRNSSDSTTAFQIQNAAGSSLISVDSQYSNITLLGNNSGEIGAWSTSPNSLPAALFQIESATVSANGYVYVIGGDTGGGAAQSTVYYAKLNADGSTGTWSTNANALPSARYGLSSVTANGFLYAIGGRDSTLAWTSTVYYAKLNADGSTGTWSTNANALPALRGYHTSIVANGYVYVIGGQNGSGQQSTVYYAKLNADGSTGTWSTNANALPETRASHSTILNNGYVYVIGGFNGSVQSTVYYAKLNADGSTGTWSTNANALPAVRTTHTSALVNGYVYVIGGTDTGGGAGTQSTVYYAKLNADGSTGTWSTNANALPAVRRGHGTISNNSYIYILSGADSGAVNTSVFYASTSRLKVGGSIDLVGSTSTGNLSESGGAGSITAGNITAVGSLQVQGAANFSDSLYANGNLGVGGLVALQPVSSLMAGQSGVTQTLTNASSTGGLIKGFSQAITVANTVSASTTYGLDITLTDNTTLNNTNQGIHVLINGTNTNQSGYGIDSISQRGVGIRGISQGIGSVNCGVGVVGGIGVCGYAQTGTNLGYGGYFALTSGSSSSSAIYGSNGTTTGKLLQLQDNATDIFTVSDNGAVLAKNSTDSTTAFQIQQAGAGTTLFTADTSGLVITVSGNTTTFATLTIDNAHFKSTQTTAPTIGTPNSCGTSPTATVTSGATDSAGSFTIETGTGTPGICDTTFTFNKAYGAAPKAVIITPASGVSAVAQAAVTGVTSTTFTVSFSNNPNPGDFYPFYYWVIE